MTAARRSNRTETQQMCILLGEKHRHTFLPSPVLFYSWEEEEEEEEPLFTVPDTLSVYLIANTIQIVTQRCKTPSPISRGSLKVTKCRHV